MIVRELVTRLGFDAQTPQARQYDDALNRVRRTTRQLITATVGLTAALGEYTRRMAQSGNETAKSAVEAGLAVDEYQELRFVMQRISQVSQNELDRALGNTNIRLQRAVSEGGAYAEVLQLMGHSTQEVADGTFTAADAFDRITEMAQNSETQAQATTAAYQLFGDRVARRLVPALQRADTDVDALRQRFRDLGGGFTEDGAGASEEFMDAMLDMRTAIQSVSIAVAEGLIPAFTETIQSVTEWIRLNRELIDQRVHAVVSMVTTALGFLWGMARRVVRVIDDTVNAWTDWDTVIRLVGAGLALIVASRVIRFVRDLTTVIWLAVTATTAWNKALRTLRRLLLVGFLIAAVEDLWSWVEGNESAIGRVLGSWENFKSAWDLLWSDLTDDLWHTIGRIVSMFVESFEALGTEIGHVFDTIGGMMAAWVREQRERLEGMIPDWMRRLLSGARTGAASVVEFASSSAAGSGGSTPSPGAMGIVGNRPRDLFGADQPVGQQIMESTRNVMQTLQVNADVSLVTPAGTPQQQAEALRSQTQQVVREVFNREIRRSVSDFEAAE